MGTDSVSQVQLYLPSEKLHVNSRRSLLFMSPTVFAFCLRPPPRCSPLTRPLPPSSQLLLCSSHAATRPHLSGPISRPSLTDMAATHPPDSHNQLSVSTHGERKRRKDSATTGEATADDNSAEPDVAVYHGAWFVPAHALGFKCACASVPLPLCLSEIACRNSV